MKFKAVIDLDGTLINSLEDIADSMNTVLKTNKYLPIMKLIIILAVERAI
jgi:phosphoglycolate phosphatase